MAGELVGAHVGRDDRRGAFLRPVTLQDAPPELLPEALRDGNPLGLWRRVDGALTRD